MMRGELPRLNANYRRLSYTAIMTRLFNLIGVEDKTIYNKNQHEMAILDANY